jgi:hypothetical protein
MPTLDFAPNWTARYKLSYRVLSKKHSMLFRFIRGTDASTGTAMAAAVAVFLNTLETYMYSDFAIIGADFAAADSDVFLPTVAPTGIAGTSSTAGVPLSERARSTSFVGRSDAGGRCIIFVYGLVLPPTDPTAGDFRVTVAENTSIANGVTALNTLSPHLVAGDGYDTNWYPYVNTKYNNYHTRKLRG